MSQKIEIVELFNRARSEHWALGQFNMSNLETLQAIVQAGNELKSPILVGVSMGTICHVGLPYIKGLMQAAHETARVPLYFHLDHGPDLDIIQKVIDIGFDSVMIDTSRLPFEENVQHVHEAVEFAHARGIGIEAQIGETWDEETGDQVQVETNPDEVEAFISGTDIDYLAFSFGNTPGRLDGSSNPDLALIKTIASISPIPVVLHGGTSIPNDVVREAIALGASKINIDTHIRQAVTFTIRDIYCQEEFEMDPRKVFAQARDAVVEAVKEKMLLFGSDNKAI